MNICLKGYFLQLITEAKEYFVFTKNIFSVALINQCDVQCVTITFWVSCSGIFIALLMLIQIIFFGGIGVIITQFTDKSIYWKSKHLKDHVLIIIHSYNSSCGTTQRVFSRKLRSGFLYNQTIERKMRH